MMPLSYAKNYSTDRVRLSAELTVDGHQFIYNNIVLLLHRVLRADGSGAVATVHDPSSPRITIDDIGGYLLHAAIRVAQDTKPETLSRGIAELTQFRELMKGCVDMRTVDRLSLDTRVK